ncbi:hypothetical protein B0H13DRAFT_2304162 [Mycena leptocephala]|nr:hypothetical protein B0H13DRAFT_2304162 [Mycena leptocephala]
MSCTTPCWAYWSEIEGRVKYLFPDLEPATITHFLVRDSDLETGETIRDGFTQVPTPWYDNQMRALQNREVIHVQYAEQLRLAKRNFAGLPDINSPANKAALNQKRAQEEEEFQTHCAERQRQRERDVEAAAAAHATSVVVQDVVPAQPAAIASLPSTSNIETAATITSGSTSIYDTSSFSSARHGYTNIGSSSSTLGSISPVPSSFVGSLAGSVAGGSMAGTPYHMSSPYEFGAGSFDAAAQLLEDTAHLALGFGSGTLSRDADAPGEDENMADAGTFATASTA